MNKEFKRAGHAMLAMVQIVGLTGTAWAESAAPERPDPARLTMSDELELLK